jgi:hypothetical protein
MMEPSIPVCRLVAQVTEIGCHSAGGAPGQSGSGQYRTDSGAYHPTTQSADAVGQLDVFVDGDVGESTGREVTELRPGRRPW